MTAIDDIGLTTIDGGRASLADWAGQVRLVVNTASKCGLTPQYAGLEALHRRYAGQGFTVLGFPANDFAGQEPGSDAEIAEFCRTDYDVTFPMFGKVKVTGVDKHPLFAALVAARPHAAANPGPSMRDKLRDHGITPSDEPELLWNFEKFLVGRDGRVIARFAPDVPPDDPMVTEAIDAALAA